MHLPINVKSPNNISKWQIGFNSVFKGLSKVPWHVTLELIKDFIFGRGQSDVVHGITDMQ
jgi:hypothetical protein